MGILGIRGIGDSGDWLQAEQSGGWEGVGLGRSGGDTERRRFVERKIIKKNRVKNKKMKTDFLRDFFLPPSLPPSSQSVLTD